MQVWAVIYDPALFTEELYQRALLSVDPNSIARIKRFYHRGDACRTLIGRLLSRIMLKDRGVPVRNMTFGATEAGKPYITTPGLDPPIGFNITHDNALVAIAFAPGIHNSPAFSIGIDVMKVRTPGRESFRSFVQTVGEQLTSLEHSLLFGNVPQDEGLRRFFWMWTLKEAYTKALGLGLGFDFRRIEFDVQAKVVRIDGAVPKGWKFSLFVLKHGEDLYEGVVAEYLGGDRTEIVEETGAADWLVSYDAATFVENTIGRLKED